jgi:hypothetical protein
MSFEGDLGKMLSDLQQKSAESEQEFKCRLDIVEKKVDKLEELFEILHTKVETDMKLYSAGFDLKFAKRLSCSEVLDSPKKSKTLFFRVHKVANNVGIFTKFIVSGSTFEVRRELAHFGVSFWNKADHTWDFFYDPEIYENVVSFLKTVTDDVKEI